jgi:WD40 repeat protein
MPHDVFISYSHHDKSAADAVCAKLEQHGIRCWIAPRDVEPGTEWAGSIIHAISKSKIMVLVFSKNANDSPQIRKEVERAVNKGVIVVPLRIEDVVPTDSLEYFMSNVHWLDALSPPLEQHLDHLAGTVKLILDRIVIHDDSMPHIAPGPTAPAELTLARPEVQLPPVSKISQPSRSLSPRAIAGLAALVIILAIAAGIYFVRNRPTVPSEPPPQFVQDRTLTGSTVQINSVAFSHDGHFLAADDAANNLSVWDLTGNSKPEPDGLFMQRPSHDGESLAFSPDGESLASGGVDDHVRIWSLIFRLEVRTSMIHAATVESVAFSPDGRLLASASMDKTIKIWDARTFGALNTLTGHTASVLSVAFSPDGRLIASASADKTIKLWDSATGREIRTLTGHSDEVRCVVFSPDGRSLASAGADKTLKLWDVATGHTLRTLTGHSDMVTSVAFSPDGHWLASGSWDQSIKLWAVESGQQVGTLMGHAKQVNSVTFRPDGYWIASGNYDGSVILWRRTN